MSTLPALDAVDRARVDRLVAAWEEVGARMRGLPVYNRRLHVEALGFHPTPNGVFGIVITPWVVSAVLLADRPRAALDLPSGHYALAAMELESFGVVETCSLLSPVLELADQSAARAFAAVALRAMLEGAS